MASEAGKGPNRRPSGVSDRVFSDHWQTIFGKKPEETTTKSKSGEFDSIDVGVGKATSPQPVSQS